MRKANQLVLAGFEQVAVSVRRLGRFARLVAGVKARHHATPGVQRGYGVHAAGEANVQVQTGGAGLLAQGRQRCIMAGVQRQHVGVVVKAAGKSPLDVAAQGLDLRRQPGLRLAFGPQQLVPEFRQTCVLALVPHNQRPAQRHFPVLERAPHMAVRQAKRLAGLGDRALVSYSMQQVHPGVANQRAGAALRLQLVGQLNFVHGHRQLSGARHKRAARRLGYARHCIRGDARCTGGPGQLGYSAAAFLQP